MVAGRHSSQRAWWSWSRSVWFSVERKVKGCLQALRDESGLPLGVVGRPRAAFLRDASIRFWDDINGKPPMIRVGAALWGKVVGFRKPLRYREIEPGCGCGATTQQSDDPFSAATLWLGLHPMGCS